MIHLPLALDLAGHDVQLIDYVLGVGIEMIAHKDRAAAGVGAVVLAELRRPVEHRVLRRGGVLAFTTPLLYSSARNDGQTSAIGSYERSGAFSSVTVTVSAVSGTV